MSNTTLAPLESAYKTVLTSSIDSTTTTIVVDVAPSVTVPVGKKIPAVLDPKNNFREVIFITGIAGTTLTVERGGPDYSGGPSTAHAHSAGSTIVITNPFNLFKDYADAIDSKLDNDGGNTTTTWDLNVAGSNFRFRLSGGDMLFADDNQAEVSLSTLAAAAGVDDKAKVSNADTTSGYLSDKVVAGYGTTLTVKNPAGNETLEVALDPTGSGVSDHEVYTPAFLTGGNAPETNVAIWDSVNDGAFRITIDGTPREMTGLNFQTPAVTSMAEVAAVIQAGIRAVTGSTETCTWSGTEFVITSANTTASSAITVTSTIAVPAGTDISGAGSAYMDCDATSTAAVTAAVLDPTADAGKLVQLAASGYINGNLVNGPTLGLTAKGSLVTASDATTKTQLAVGADGSTLVADSTAPGGLAWSAASQPDFVGVGTSASKNLNYTLPWIGWTETSLSSSTITPALYKASCTTTVGALSARMGPVFDTSVSSFNLCWDNVFTKITVDWWMAANTGGGDSQYGLSGDVSSGYTRTDVNEEGCYFFWDTGTTLSIVTADGAANTTTALVGPPTINQIQNYRIEHTTGVDTKFYINGSLVGTHTTNLPSSASTDIIYFGGGLDDNGSGTDVLYMGPVAVSIET